jgi:hypothetical protein
MDDEKLIDDCFFVKQKSWKTWGSYDKNHKFLVTALTKENCIESTRWYLKFLQDTK